jgi:hypothetical protein
MGWIDPLSGRRVMIEMRGESCVATDQLLPQSTRDASIRTAEQTR